MSPRPFIHRALFTALFFAACTGAPDLGELAPANQSQAIQGGTVDQSDPNVVGIVINTGGGIAICSGSLIAPNLVLTAHHCVASIGSTQCATNSFGSLYAPGSFYVTTSYNAASNSFSTGQLPTVDHSTWFGVAKVMVPGNNVCGQDMGLLELSSSVSGVCPLVPRTDTAVALNEAYTAVGFGITSPNSQAAGKRYTVSGLKVLCAANCPQGMSPTLEWEGGTTAARGTCEGDSGGPALDAQGRVIGTVSRGPGNTCNDTVYEGITGHAAWLKQQGQLAANDGSYTAPAWVTATSTTGLSGCGSGTGGGTGAGGGSGAGGGTGTGGGTTTGADCVDPSLQCVDASGAGNFACIDPTTSTGFPASATVCARTSDCPSNYTCWTSGTRSRCLQACGSSATTGAGGGSGTGGGAGTAGGVGTGGGTTSGAGGGTGTAGGVATGGGTTTGAAGGSGGVAAYVPNVDTGGSATLGAAEGCGCTAGSGLSSSWLLMAGLGLLRRRRSS